MKDKSKSFLEGRADVSNTVVFTGLQTRLRVTALASCITLEDSSFGEDAFTPRKGDGTIFGLAPFGRSSSAPPRFVN